MRAKAPTPPFAKMNIVLKQGLFIRSMATTIMGLVVCMAVDVRLGLALIIAAIFALALEHFVYARLHPDEDERWARGLMLATTVLASFAFVGAAPVLLALDTGPAAFMGALFIGTMLIYQAVYYGHSDLLARFAVPPIAATIGLCFVGMAYQAYQDGQHGLIPVIGLMCLGYVLALLTLRKVLYFRAGKLRRLIADAKSASRAKSEFLANMSHEIRTPMNGIVAMADMLQSSELTATQLQYADIITTSGENLLVIINDILDFSKLESRKLELDPDTFDLLKLVEEVASLVAPKTADKVDVATFVDPLLPRELIGDSVRIRQVLLNLVGNAAKFTEEGSILITVLRGEGDYKGEGLPISVRVHDTGIGIEAEAVEQMFEKFSQATTGTTKLYGGTGLGLAICKDLVSLMGGRMVASSQLGQGSVFGFDLQLPVNDPKVIMSTHLQLSGETVAIVAREAALHWSLHALLGRHGLSIRPWCAPDQARQQIATYENPPDIIIVDPNHADAVKADMEMFEPGLRPSVISLCTPQMTVKETVQAISIPVRSEVLLTRINTLLSAPLQSDSLLLPQPVKGSSAL